MDTLKIYNVLTLREQYKDTQAKLVLHEIQNLNPDYIPYFLAWVENPEDQHDIIFDGISLCKLMEKKGMNYLAALLTIDWLAKEPSIAKPIIEGFFK